MWLHCVSLEKLCRRSMHFSHRKMVGKPFFYLRYGSFATKTKKHRSIWWSESEPRRTTGLVGCREMFDALRIAMHLLHFLVMLTGTSHVIAGRPPWLTMHCTAYVSLRWHWFRGFAFVGACLLRFCSASFRSLSQSEFKWTFTFVVCILLLQ